MPDEPNASTRAEELFGAFLADHEEGDAPSVEVLVAEHPDLARELRALDAEWRALDSLRERLGDRAQQDDPAEGFASEPVAGGPESPESVLSALRERDAPVERYRFRGEIGRGGMGIVLRVYDEDLRRELAMKVMRSDAAGSGTPRASGTRSLGRFLEEAQVTGQLDHPGIVPVHEVGLNVRDEPFFTMKLVDGQDLARVFELVKARRDGWTVPRALGVVLKVCEAMAYAHSRGVVHRDLKPSNVMVGDFGAVYVMDWGLARVIGEHAPGQVDASAPEHAPGDAEDEGAPVDVRGLHTVRSGSDSESGLATLDGEVVGTPAYMAPEQAAGATAEIGPTVDVYAVGAMVYHLLAGRMPHTEGDAGAATVLRRVRNREAKPLATLAPEAPAELVSIAEKAMAHEPRGRYPSMHALAEDLRAYLEGRVVRAHETGSLAELRKWVARNRPLAGAIAAGVAAAVLGLGAAAWTQSQARVREQAVNARLKETNRQLDEARTAAVKSEAVAVERATEAVRERQAADGVVDFLVGLFEAPDPANTRGETVSAEELLDRGVASIADDAGLEPLVRARLLLAMGQAYQSLGTYDQAIESLQTAARLRSQELGDDHPGTGDARIAFARALMAVGRLDEAEAISNEQLERFDLAEDGERAVVLGARATRVAIQSVRGDWSAVSAEAEEVLGLLDDSPASADIRFYVQNNYAQALFLTGEIAHSESVYHDLVQRARNRFGDDHPRTIRAEESLGQFYLYSDDFRGAKGLLERVVEKRRRIYGVDHPRTLDTLGDLGRLLPLLRPDGGIGGHLLGADRCVRPHLRPRARLRDRGAHQPLHHLLEAGANRRRGAAAPGGTPGYARSARTRPRERAHLHLEPGSHCGGARRGRRRGGLVPRGARRAPLALRTRSSGDLERRVDRRGLLHAARSLRRRAAVGGGTGRRNAGGDPSPPWAGGDARGDPGSARRMSAGHGGGETECPGAT